LFCLSACSTSLLTQKTKTIEIGSSLSVQDLVTPADKVIPSFKTEPTLPLILGKIDFSFLANKDDIEKEFTFSYTVVDTTLPVILKTKDAVIFVGSEFNPLDYVSVTDNSAENLNDKVIVGIVSTTTVGDYVVELSVKDSSGNQAIFSLPYKVVDLMSLAPEITGTTKTLKTINGLERVTYVSAEGNPYSVPAGQYVGEFRKEVVLDGVEVGGVVLIPKVVEKLMSDKANNAFFVPADISEINNKDIISLDRLSDRFLGGDILRIDTKGNKVSLASPFLGECKLGVFWGGTQDEELSFMMMGITAFFGDFEEHNEYGLYINGDFEKFLVGNLDFAPRNFGAKIAETNKLFSLSGINDLYSQEMLKVANSVVFMKDQN